MTDEKEQQRIRMISTEQSRWVGGSTIVDKFTDVYDLDELISNGRCADVYKCRLKNRHTIRAVKCFRKRGPRKTPIKNVSHVLQLDHPNLVAIREILESRVHLFIVQDYVDGPNLFHKIIQTEVHTEYDVSKYCLQILTGLRYMHERNVFHGKLHGENVLVRNNNDEQPVLCLVDYAYSNLCTRDAIALLVNVTPSFCAPEILRGEPFSATSDMWQLGILIFFCLSGTYPFHGSQNEIFHNILKGTIDYSSPEWEHVSNNGRSFVARLLKPVVRDRMTIIQALQHPWIREKVYRTANLAQAQANITAIQTQKDEHKQHESHTDDIDQV